jgi:hypothetical protein
MLVQYAGMGGDVSRGASLITRLQIREVLRSEPSSNPFSPNHVHLF